MNSILLVDKPSGLTSSQVVNDLKRILKEKKIGHSGTLDKFASGLLVICAGWTTRFTRFFLESDKRYIGTIKLGTVTDTCDPEGKIIEEKGTGSFDPDMIKSIPEKFIGEIMQIPPVYSALKVNGRRASDIIRKGEELSLKERKITIKKLDILKIDLDNSALTVDVSCSKGTYIRSLAKDIGDFLGTGAYLESLRRVASGNFFIENAAGVDEIRSYFSGGDKTDKRFILSPEEALTGFSEIQVGSPVKKKVLNGAFFSRDEILSIEKRGINPFIILDEEKNLIAIADIDIDNWIIKYLSVFNR